MGLVISQRDAARPPMELCVETIDELFGSPEMNITQATRGPSSWVWCDMSAPGWEKTYTLTGSALKGAEGYPLFTVRQAIAPRLDSYITFSQLLIGPDRTMIQQSVSHAVVHHSGQFAGLHSTLQVIANEGLSAGLAHALSLGSGTQVTAADVLDIGAQKESN